MIGWGAIDAKGNISNNQSTRYPYKREQLPQEEGMMKQIAGKASDSDTCGFHKFNREQLHPRGIRGQCCTCKQKQQADPQRYIGGFHTGGSQRSKNRTDDSSQSKHLQRYEEALLIGEYGNKMQSL